MLLKYLRDKKEQLRGLMVFPREMEVARTRRFIIPLTGPRRSGKTFYMYDLILNKLRIRDEDFIFMNFEDPQLIGANITDIMNAVNIHEELHGKKPRYIFLDEVQNVQRWESAIRGLYESGEHFIFVSGSSSKLLSKEITTSLRGRTLAYAILPLSFREYLSFKKIQVRSFPSTSEENRLKNHLRNYLKYGGFPDIVFENQLAERFFREYLDLVVFRDVVERHGIKNVFIIKFMVRSLLMSFSKHFSVHSIFNSLKSQGIKVSKKTLYNYLSYLEEAFFVFFNRKFSYSLKESELSIPKVFINDTGLVNFSVPGFSENMGRLMENAVFLELKRRQNREPFTGIYYYRGRGEVDFIVTKNAKPTELIQVCYGIEDVKTKEREIKALLDASKKLVCKNLLILTWDYEGDETFKNRKIKFTPLWKWLLFKQI